MTDPFSQRRGQSLRRRPTALLTSSVFALSSPRWPRRSACASGSPRRQVAFVRAHRESRARRLRRPHRRHRPSQGGGLHGGQAAPRRCCTSSSTRRFCCDDAWRRARRHRRLDEGHRHRPPVARRAAVRGGRRDLRRGQPALFVVADLPHRGALRLQPDDVALWLSDLAKGVAVAVVLGLPLLVLVLWLMRAAGRTVVAVGLGRVDGVPGPGARAVSDPHCATVQQVHAAGRTAPRASASRRCSRDADFAAPGLFVMDGSKRSGHGNAYFTGFGTAKRIVFFDTLLERLAPDEIEAVLAHELGHYKLRHVAKRVAWSARCRSSSSPCSRGSRAEPWFYPGLGIPEPLLAWRWRVPASRCSSSCSRCRCSRSCSSRCRRCIRASTSSRPTPTPRATPQARRAHAGAGQAVRGQRRDADARSAAFGVLRFASAGGGAYRPHRGAGRGSPVAAARHEDRARHARHPAARAGVDALPRRRAGPWRRRARRPRRVASGLASATTAASKKRSCSPTTTRRSPS